MNFCEEGNEPIIFNFGTVIRGDALEALRLAETIMKSKVATVARGGSFIGSAGLYIFLACKARIATSKAILGLHPLIYPVRGSMIIDPYSLARLQNRIKKHNTRIAFILRERTCWLPEEIHAVITLVKGSVILTAKKAEEAGMITKIVTSF